MEPGSEELYGYSRQEAIGQQKNILLRTTVPGSSFENLRQSLIEARHGTASCCIERSEGRF